MSTHTASAADPRPVVAHAVAFGSAVDVPHEQREEQSETPSAPSDEPRAVELLLHRAAGPAASHLTSSWLAPSATPSERLVATALNGRRDAAGAAVALGLQSPTVVICVESGSEQIFTAFVLHLHAAFPSAVATAPCGRDFVAVPVGRHEVGDIATVCRSFLEVVKPEPGVFIGIGGPACSAFDLGRSRAEAEAAALALRALGDERRVALHSELLIETLLREFREQLREESRGPSGAYARLLAYDKAKGTHLVDTVSAWLECFGDVAMTAARQGVHPNTLRYRLTRVAEVGEVDLDQSEARFQLQLQLHLFGSPGPLA